MAATAPMHGSNRGRVAERASGEVGRGLTERAWGEVGRGPAERA